MRSKMEWGLGFGVWGLGFGVQGLGFGTGFGAGNMKQDEHRKHETRGGTGSGMGDERISRNDKVGGITDRTEPGQWTVEGCTPNLKLGRSLEGDLGHSTWIFMFLYGIEREYSGAFF